MARKCPLTGKAPLSGNNRSHALNATRRKWNVNLQNTKIMVDGKMTKVRLSTKAMKILRKKQSQVKASASAPKT